MKFPFSLLLLVGVFSFGYSQQPGTEISTTGEKIRLLSFVPLHFQRQELYALPVNEIIREHVNEKPLLQTTTKRGKLHGNWQSWYQNGQACDSGRFEKGLPDGVWKHWNEKGELVSIRTYSADKYHRVANAMVRYHPRKITYPLAAMYQVNRSRALSYLQTSYSFAGTIRRASGLSLAEATGMNMQPGNVYRPVFDHALHHGLYMNFGPGDVAKDSGYYRDGLRHGLWVHRDLKEGRFEKGLYHHGIKVKEWRTYDSNGKLEKLIVYSVRGKLRKERYFN